MSSVVLMIAIYSSIFTLWGLGYDCVNNKFTDESCENLDNLVLYLPQLFGDYFTF